MPTPDVVQEAVVALPHNRADRAGRQADFGIAGQHIVDNSIGHAGNVERVGQQNRGLDHAQFADLLEAQRLAKPVERPHRSDDLLLKEVSAMRQDGGHAGADRPLARPQRPVASDQRDMPDPDAGHVSDGIKPAGGQQTGRNAQVAQARHQPASSAGRRQLRPAARRRCAGSAHPARSAARRPPARRCSHRAQSVSA